MVVKERFELILTLPETVLDDTGHAYTVRVYGEPSDDCHWHGWLAFFPVGAGHVLVTDQETSQPNRRALEYWAGGLTRAYIEGAFERAEGLEPERLLRDLRQRLREEGREAALEARRMREAAGAAQRTADALSIERKVAERLGKEVGRKIVSGR
jgi:hypothetical protein